MAEETPQTPEDQSTDQPSPGKSEEEKPAGETTTPKAQAKSAEQVKAEARSPRKAVAVDEKGSLWMSRRNFFSRAGWAAFLSFVASMLIGSVRFMFPRVLFEPSPVFKAGYPDGYPVGAVNTSWIKEQRVWIIRDEEGFYAILAKCTHLGCTPRWLDAENKFKCPCHGSGFNRFGINFEGPAPRPLERLKITLAEDGQLLIDKSVRFREEKGEWGKPGSFLAV